MNTYLTLNRFLYPILPSIGQKTLALITGARQTGKTTLAKHKYQDLSYVNLDAPENREKVREIPTALWSSTLGQAIIDEAQKEPVVFDKIKYAYDEGSLTFSVLLGSSQVLMLKKVRESLAGRVKIFELFPLMMAEIATKPDQTLQMPLFDKLLTGKTIDAVLSTTKATLFGEEELAAKKAHAFLLQWGGMPALIHISEQERFKWLKDYEYTYLERDLADLARIQDLQPFRTFQKVAALRTASLLQYSEIARDTGISVDTARRYLEYLKISYQTLLLQPYQRNLTSSVIKTPKLYWLDVGIWRAITGQTEAITGELYETMVVSEINKWIRTLQRNVELFFYRTHTGLEADLLLQMPQGIIGMEVKYRKNIAIKDVKALLQISAALKEEWLGGILIYDGDYIKKIAEPNIWAVPAWRLLT